MKIWPSEEVQGFSLCRVRGGAAGLGKVESGAHRAEAAQCGQSGHYRMWLLSNIALRPEMGQDLLLFWCQQRAVKAPSQASVTGPDGTFHAVYDTN